MWKALADPKCGSHLFPRPSSAVAPPVKQVLPSLCLLYAAPNAQNQQKNSRSDLRVWSFHSSATTAALPSHPQCEHVREVGIFQPLFILSNPRLSEQSLGKLSASIKSINLQLICVVWARPVTVSAWEQGGLTAPLSPAAHAVSDPAWPQSQSPLVMIHSVNWKCGTSQASSGLLFLLCSWFPVVLTESWLP